MITQEKTTNTQKPSEAIIKLLYHAEIENKYKRKAWLLLSMGLFAFFLGYFCLGAIAPIISIPVWIISSNMFLQISNIEIPKYKRLLETSMIISIIATFNGPMLFFYIQPIDINALLPPNTPIKENYLAIMSGQSLGDLAYGITIASIFCIPLLFFKKTRKWKIYFVFLTIIYALLKMILYAGEAIDAGLYAHEARKIGLLICPFFMCFTLVFFHKTRRWYILIPLFILFGFLAGTQISQLK